MKKIYYLFVGLLLFIPTTVFGVSISANNIKVKQGGTGTIYVKASGDKKIAGGQFNVSSKDTGKVTITNVKGAGIFTNYGNKSTAIIYNNENKGTNSPTNIAAITVKVNSNATVGSVIGIAIKDAIVSLVDDYDTFNASNITPTVTVLKKDEPVAVVEKNSDATLKSLIINEYDIVFQSDKTNYLAVVNSTVSKLTINAVPNSNKSTVKINGNENLIDGENKVSIVVTSEKGTTKTYEILVYKLKKDEACKTPVVDDKEDEKRDEKIWVYISYGLLVVIIAETIYIVASENKKKK